MTLRRVVLPQDAPYDALMARIAAFTRERSTLVVEARISARALRAKVAEAGGDVDHLHVLDATGAEEATTAGDETTTNIAGPHLLELIALRAKQLAVHKAERRVAVIIDDVLTFGHYNEPGALVETIHLARSLHDDSNIQEYVIHPDTPAELQGRLETILEDAVVVGADGLGG